MDLLAAAKSDVGSAQFNTYHLLLIPQYSLKGICHMLSSYKTICKNENLVLSIELLKVKLKL